MEIKSPFPMTYSCGAMRAAAESSRMRSLVCCGVSRTACARLGGARTTNPSRVMETRHNAPAPSLAGCIRIDDPQDDYTDRRTKSISEFGACQGSFPIWECWGWVG